MKTTLTLLTVLVVFTEAQGQPIIDSSNFTPSHQEKIIRAHCDYTSPFSTIGSGANISWDFSGLINLSSDTITYVTPDTAGYVPNNCFGFTCYSYANFSHGRPYGTAMLQYTNDGMINRGYCQGNTIFHCSYEIRFPFPITYTTNFLDTFYTITTHMQPMQYNSSGTSITYLNADGYGSLILPNGTYSSALKVTVIKNDSMFDPFFFPNGIGYIDTTIYWLVPNVEHPVLEIKYPTQAGMKNAIYISSVLMGVPEPLTIPAAVIFPNPFFNSTTFQAGRNLRNATLVLFNSLGKEIKVIKNISGPSYVLSRDNLPDGIYFLRCIQEDQVIGFEKLIVAGN